jgi:hypothetical protein
MVYQEIRSLVMSVTNIAVLIAYCITVFGKAGQKLELSGDLKPWAIMILTFIGIGIAAAVLIQIVFHILLSVGIAIKNKLVDESITDKEIEKRVESEIGRPEDERDKLIDLKAGRIGQIISGVGVVTALIYTALGHSGVVMLNIVFLSFGIASASEGFIKAYYYRKGVRNG